MTLWLRYALRNLRSGLRGFWIFLTCLTLGVAAIAIIGSLTASVDRGLAEQGQPVMGGDLEFSLIQRDVSDAEKAFIASTGEVSRVVTMRAMATANERSTLVEIKAVDAAYPLYGEIKLTAEQPQAGAYALVNGRHGVAVDDLLLGRLGLKIGDSVKIGQLPMEVRATIAQEPDRISDGIVLGPRLLMSHEAMAQTGLIQPGSLITWRYRVKLAGDTSLSAAKAVIEEAQDKFPDAGWRVRARDNAAGGAERFVERLGYFMTLVSVAALVIGGAGIANAVAAFVNRRMGTIATLKCLGIANRDVFGMFLVEIMLVGLLGIAIGLVAGAVAPAVVSAVAGDVIPLPLSARVEWLPLGLAGVLGFLVTLAFAIWPLARIANVNGTSLFRTSLSAETGRPNWRYLLVSLALLGLAAGIVLLAFQEMRITAYYLVALVLSFVALAALAYGLIKLASVLPRPGNVLWRHAVQSLYRPGAPSLSIILALGLGLTLFVTLALTDRTISNELRAGIPQNAPAFFFLDVRNDELAGFKDKALQQKGAHSLSNAPMMRGRIVKVKGVAADKVEAAPDAQWALRGDRGLTYAELLPEGSVLTQGTWWNKDYSGPPLVSMVDEIAEGLGLKIGDKITVNVLGRDIEATIHNLRTVNWRSMGINFVMVFTPNTLRAAPHSHLVTVDMTDGDEAAFLNTMAQTFPSVTAVRVKDALNTVSDVLGQMLTAVRGASALTLLTGILVLAGALAAGLSSRSYEAVVLKTYGATRRQLLQAFAIEYGLLGLVAAVFGIVVGSIASWALARWILEMPFSFAWEAAALTAIVSVVLTIAAGMIVTYRALSTKPSTYLRNE
jgi:putative ABC transport system permease protein